MAGLWRINRSSLKHCEILSISALIQSSLTLKYHDVEFRLKLTRQ